MEEMRLRTRRDVMRSAPSHWKSCYLDNNGTWAGPYPWGDPHAIYDELMKLDMDTVTRAQVDAVHAGLTFNRCSECSADEDVLIRLGPEPDYESDPFDICFSCLVTAIVMIPPRVYPPTDEN